MPISGFDWDEDNILHIARHDFGPEEVEEVFAGNHKVRRARQQLYIALGETLDGRLVFVVFRRLPKGVVRVITALRYGSQRTAAVPPKVETMKKTKTLRPATTPLPAFQSDKEAAAYFDTHSVADIWDQLPQARQSKPSPVLQQSIQQRRATTKSAISIRLIPEQIEAAKKIAAKKSVGYQTQLRMWIAEGIRREAKSTNQ